MRALLLLLVLLAGCTSDGGLNAYLLHPGDLGDICELADPQDPDYAFLRDELNWTSNPGSVDNEVFEEEGIMPTTNRVVVYDCTGGDTFSVAMRFASNEAADEWLSYEADCPDEGVFRDGPIVGFLEGGGSDELEARVMDAYERLLARSGARPVCDMDGPETQ